MSTKPVREAGSQETPHSTGVAVVSQGKLCRLTQSFAEKNISFMKLQIRLPPVATTTCLVQPSLCPLSSSFHMPTSCSLQRPPAVFGAHAGRSCPATQKLLPCAYRSIMDKFWARLAVRPKFNPWDKEKLPSQFSGELHPRVKLQNVRQDLHRRRHCGSRQCSSCPSQACSPRGEVQAPERLGQGSSHREDCCDSNANWLDTNQFGEGL